MLVRNVMVLGMLLISSCLYAETPHTSGRVLVSEPGENAVLDPVYGALSKDENFDDLKDHKAVAVSVEGQVQIMKKSASEWKTLEKDAVIEEGDVVLTSAESSVQISYDRYFLNLVRIGEKTRAEFRSIEPTNIHMEDGTIFSALDGLQKGTEYQISSPTALAAVRGTHFEVSYDAVTQEFSAATIPVTDDDHASRIEISKLMQDGTRSEALMMDEGFEMRLGPQEMPAVEKLSEIRPEVVARANGHFQGFAQQKPQEFNQLREEGLQKIKNFETLMPPLPQPEDRKIGTQPPHDGMGPGGSSPADTQTLSSGDASTGPPSREADTLVDRVMNVAMHPNLPRPEIQERDMQPLPPLPPADKTESFDPSKVRFLDRPFPQQEIKDQIHSFVQPNEHPGAPNQPPPPPKYPNGSAPPPPSPGEQG